MDNIITIDLEDWHALAQRWLSGFLPPPSTHVFRQVDLLLDILDQHQTKATFFVLGPIAEIYPGLVKQIADQGHEISSHGYSHVPIYKLSLQDFRDETARSKVLLEDIIGDFVSGYRAAQFSIIRQTLWALDILAELGFSYDSSIFPMFHRRYGIHDFPKAVKRYELPNNLKIIEIPLSTFLVGKLSWSLAGGGYFRLTPLAIIERVMSKQHNEHTPMVTYFHPYEFDPCYLNTFQVFQPRTLKECARCLRANFLQNLGRRTVPNKLSFLLKRFRFSSCRGYLVNSKIIEEKLPEFP